MELDATTTLHNFEWKSVRLGWQRANPIKCELQRSLEKCENQLETYLHRIPVTFLSEAVATEKESGIVLYVKCCY